MIEYDSILKEKKKKKHFPYVTLILIAFFVLLIVSYLIYYNTILSGNEIILNNLSRIKEKYRVITNNLLLDKIFNDDIEGSILIDNTYTYNFMKDNKRYYLQTPTLSTNTYVSNDIINSVNTNISLSNVSEDKYIKKFYFDEKTPVVEIIFILDKLKLEKIFNTTLDSDYEVTITSRNNALSNEILSMKIVINNKSKGDIKVIIFEENNILFNDNNSNYEFKTNINDSTFNVKIYKDNELYSVLSGTPTLNTYKYTYQIIDELYTINLITSKKDDNYKYELSSNINHVNSSMVLNVSDMSNLSNKLIETIDNNKLTEVDRLNYDNDVKFLKDFINKY